MGQINQTKNTISHLQILIEQLANNDATWHEKLLTTPFDTTNFSGIYPSQDASSAYAKAAALNAIGIEGLEIQAITVGTEFIGTIGGNPGNSYTLLINGIEIFNNTDVSVNLTNTQLRDGINSVNYKTGIIASLKSNKITLSARDGRNIEVIESGNGFVAGLHGLTIANGPFSTILQGKLIINTNLMIM